MWHLRWDPGLNEWGKGDGQKHAFIALSLSLPDVDTDRPDVSTFSTFPSFHDGLEL